MKTSWCAPVLLIAIGCTASQPRATLPEPPREETRYIRVKAIEEGHAVIREVPLEDYVQTAALSEFAPQPGDPAAVARMLEVQAIVSRTYAVANIGRHAREGFDLCSTTHCQLYEPDRLGTSRWAALSAQAVRNTSGIVLWYDRGPIDALFHADCGGRTSGSAAVWGGASVPYLISILDDGPAEAAHAEWRFEVGRDALIQALNTDSRTRVDDRLDSIEILDRDEAGRAERVALHGRRESIPRGEDLRDVLNRTLGARALRSTLFEVQQNGPTFTFAGRGFGHGVGLCQAGAFARVRAGETLAAVFQHYYPGTKLQSLVAGRWSQVP